MTLAEYYSLPWYDKDELSNDTETINYNLSLPEKNIENTYLGSGYNSRRDLALLADYASRRDEDEVSLGDEDNQKTAIDVANEVIGNLSNFANTAYEANKFYKAYKASKNAKMLANATGNEAASKAATEATGKAAGKLAGQGLAAATAAIEVGKDIDGKLKTKNQNLNTLSNIGNNVYDYSNIRDNQALLNSYNPYRIQDIAHQSTASKLGNVGAKTGSFATTGAALGNAIPGIGTAVGAIGGAIYGLASGVDDWIRTNRFENKADQLTHQARQREHDNYYDQVAMNNKLQIRNNSYGDLKIVANGGSLGQIFEPGTELEVDDEAYNELIKQGYKIEII